jgi:hypothetical protein
LKSATGKDLEFVKKLLILIEEAGIPAPSPIEQVRNRVRVRRAMETVKVWVGVRVC